MTPPTVLKFYFNTCSLSHRKIPLYLLTATCMLLPPGSLSPSAPSRRPVPSLHQLAPSRRGRACAALQVASRRGRGPAGMSVRRGVSRCGCGPRAGWDELALGRPASCRRVRSQAHAAGDRLAAATRLGVGWGRRAAAGPPGRARVRPGEPPPPPDAAKRRGNKGQGGR